MPHHTHACLRQNDENSVLMSSLAMPLPPTGRVEVVALIFVSIPALPLSVPQPPSQDCRLPTVSWAISMYDKCQVCRQANLVSALPR